MIIDCISDLHGHYPELEGGDLLIIAGDLTASDTPEEHLEFIKWCAWQNYKKIVFIVGNHDNTALKEPSNNKKIEYLCDSGTEFEYIAPSVLGNIVGYEGRKLKIWGSPWTLTFPGINPKCAAFTGDERLLAEKFALIPDDVDILITHGPPLGILDLTVDGRNVGSMSLISRYKTICPKLHIFGHIHESYCESICEKTRFINCSHVNERYEPVNKPIRIIL
jgi:Icc-related predicted phosphoesterase